MSTIASGVTLSNSLDRQAYFEDAKKYLQKLLDTERSSVSAIIAAASDVNAFNPAADLPSGIKWEVVKSFNEGTLVRSTNNGIYRWNPNENVVANKSSVFREAVSSICGD